MEFPYKNLYTYSDTFIGICSMDKYVHDISDHRDVDAKILYSTYFSEDSLYPTEILANKAHCKRCDFVRRSTAYLTFNEKCVKYTDKV